MTGLRSHLHRYWFTFDHRDRTRSQFALGVGATGVDRADAQHLIRDACFGGDELPPIVAIIEDVDVRDLDAGHVVPNMGDPSVRGVWYPRI